MKVVTEQFSRYEDYSALSSHNVSRVSVSDQLELIDVEIEEGLYCQSIFLAPDDYDPNSYSAQKVDYYFYIVSEHQSFNDDPNFHTQMPEEFTETIFLKRIDKIISRYVETYYIFYKRTFSQKEIRNEKIVSLLHGD
jgi:hypothetical protein